MIYQIMQTFPPEMGCVSIKTDDGEYISGIPYDPENTDYQKFKYNINNNLAQLKDVDGVLMTSTQAKAYVATLP